MGTAPTEYAGYFAGNVHVAGNLSASGGKPFRIDHPLDPENKYLYHYAMESPEILNLYRGTAVLNTNGEAWAELPDYFESINRDFTYQLTAVGAPMPNLHVGRYWNQSWGEHKRTKRKKYTDGSFVNRLAEAGWRTALIGGPNCPAQSAAAVRCAGRHRNGDRRSARPGDQGARIP